MMSNSGSKTSLPKLDINKFLYKTNISAIIDHYASLSVVHLRPMISLLKHVIPKLVDEETYNSFIKNEIDVYEKSSILINAHCIFRLFGPENRYSHPSMKTPDKWIKYNDSLDLPNCQKEKRFDKEIDDVDKVFLFHKTKLDVISETNKVGEQLYGELIRPLYEGTYTKPLPLSKKPSSFLMKGIFFSELEKLSLDSLKNMSVAKMLSAIDGLVSHWTNYTNDGNHQEHHKSK